MNVLYSADKYQVNCHLNDEILYLILQYKQQEKQLEKKNEKKTIILQDNFHMMRNIITGKNVNHAC